MRTIPKVGGTKDVMLDKVRALAPTQVIVNVDENLRERRPRPGRVRPARRGHHPLAPRDNLELYQLLGGIFGRTEEEERLCAAFEAAYARAVARAAGQPPRDVLYLIWREP